MQSLAPNVRSRAQPRRWADEWRKTWRGHRANGKFAVGVGVSASNVRARGGGLHKARPSPPPPALGRTSHQTRVRRPRSASTHVFPLLGVKLEKLKSATLFQRAAHVPLNVVDLGYNGAQGQALADSLGNLKRRGPPRLAIHSFAIGKCDGDCFGLLGCFAEVGSDKGQPRAGIEREQGKEEIGGLR